MITKKIDIFLILPLIAIIALGLMTLASALSYNPQKFFVQVLWVVIATGVFIFTSYKNKRIWENSSIPLFWANIILLILVLVIGKKIAGSQRWLDLGFMNFQVSELSKLSIILFISYRLNQKPKMMDGYRIFDLVPEILAVFATFALIYKEPDLGTALLVAMMALAMIASSKVNIKSLLYLFIVVLICAPLLWKFMLKPYQKTRIVAIVTMHSEENSSRSLTSQYHTKQSMIAVGSAGLYGKGYKKGTQNILRFIPEHHTDFIFSVYAEEFGFFGIILLFCIYLLLFYRMIKIIPTVKEKFSGLVIVGTLSLLWIQIVVNIGMVTGVLPVVGIPLPFFSYGGSSLLLNSVLMGLVHNISITSVYKR